MEDNTAIVNDSNQYLTFTLGEEHYALEINKVSEVLDFMKITRVPRMPGFLRGVINLRGNVVPVVDLRLKLGMSAIKRTVDTCIVIVEVEMDGETIHMGALADSVKEVVALHPDQISPPPRFGMRLDTKFIKGMGKQDEEFLIILDIDRVLSSEELAAVCEAGEGQGQEELPLPEAMDEPPGEALGAPAP